MEDTRKIIGNRIKYLRTHSGYTQEGLAEKIGLKGKSSIANYESGKISPSDSIKLQLCKVFHCSMDYLMGKSNFYTNKQLLNKLSDNIFKNRYIIKSIDSLTKINLTYSEAKELIKDIIYISNEYYYDLDNHILTYVRKYPTDIQQQLLNFINTFNDNYSFEIKDNSILFVNRENGELSEINLIDNKSNLFLIPILGKITAGQPILADENIEGYLPTSPEIHKLTDPDGYFYLKVLGNSMNKIVKNGSYVLIEKQDYADDGDIIVAIVNGDQEATLKKYKRINDNLIVLEPQSDDPNFEPIYIDKDTNFKILGKAIGYFGKF